MRQDSGRAQPSVSSALRDAGWDHRIAVRGLYLRVSPWRGHCRQGPLSLPPLGQLMRELWEELQPTLQIMAQLGTLHPIFLLHPLSLDRFKGKKIDFVSQSQEKQEFAAIFCLAETLPWPQIIYIL